MMSSDLNSPRTPTPAEKARAKAKATKHCSRLAVAQALYSLEISRSAGLSAEKAVQQMLGHYQSGALVYPGAAVAGEVILPKLSFIQKIIDTLALHQETLDATITAHLSDGWDLPKMGPMLTVLLRAAMAELVHYPEVPTKVVIDEYVSLASYFYEDNEVRFMNGILEQLGKVVRHDAR
jgi:N utilization substance protein B